MTIEWWRESMIQFFFSSLADSALQRFYTDIVYTLLICWYAYMLAAVAPAKTTNKYQYSLIIGPWQNRKDVYDCNRTKGISTASWNGLSTSHSFLDRQLLVHNSEGRCAHHWKSLLEIYSDIDTLPSVHLAVLSNVQGWAESVRMWPCGTILQLAWADRSESV